MLYRRMGRAVASWVVVSQTADGRRWVRENEDSGVDCAARDAGRRLAPPAKRGSAGEQPAKELPVGNSRCCGRRRRAMFAGVALDGDEMILSAFAI